ncbi:hypothetical protein K450DRAFT_190161 [Umbelopsis ramanniana AG]|uniref:NmrA-like domain-containing protein n=1 Tax=Umbelopsis ramanniana AG TaxID=1314678 RepID=A0AAD5HBM1_UMBRA|nr:uncharacterized protein K450DRAFT_190161 [Umbelopsis ramanniana AG]KAI8578280.1 hypothetical protein K450DRAFT_190161 [Umbelopsis ramanniana AG]
MSSPSIDPTGKIIVVFGITGKQGGAAAQALLDKGFKVRGVTRDVNSSKSKAWAGKGAELITANLNDTKSLEKAFDGAYGVFLITDHSESGAVEKEIQKGRNTADVAVAKNVKHLVFTSVGNAGAAKFPEFYNKYEIEQYIAKKSELTNTVIRPANFFENYAKDSSFAPKDGVFPSANAPEKRIQAVGCRDIGLIAAEAFQHPEEYSGQVIELSAEELDHYEIAEIFTKVTGTKWQAKQMWVFKYGIVTLIGSKYGKMAKFWENPGYCGDVKALRAKYPWLQTWEEYITETYGPEAK